MAVTRLKRKDRRNKARAHNRLKRIKQLTRRPVIKRLETEEQPAQVAAPAAAAAEETTADQEEE